MHTTLRPHSMTSRLLENGQARVDEMLRKGYAPSHFSHNLELILIGDTRSSNSPSMQTKIANTRERSACLRTLEPLILIWWAAAFPMRQWSGGRKISSSTFESLIQHVPRHAAHTRALLALVGDDLGRLSQKYLFCETLHNFLNGKWTIHVSLKPRQFGPMVIQ
jgi:hypothetical protein